jgi:putative thiamine transport system permease protein
MAVIYVIVFLLLAIMSVSSSWPYPYLWPSQFRLTGWENLVNSPAPLINSLTFAVCSTVAGLILAVVWFETMGESLDRYVLALAFAALALPSLLIADGQYQLFLHLGLNGTWAGVFLAHLTPVFAYVFIVLKGPYRAFDPRLRSVSFGLNASALQFWLAIKMPLLKPAVAGAAAIGIGVSIAQYVPVQLIASGRLSTLTIEAVTLTSGGNRQLLAIYSLLLMVIPLLGFMAADRTGRHPA